NRDGPPTGQPTRRPPPAERSGEHVQGHCRRARDTRRTDARRDGTGAQGQSPPSRPHECAAGRRRGSRRGHRRRSTPTDRGGGCAPRVVSTQPAGGSVGASGAAGGSVVTGGAAGGSVATGGAAGGSVAAGCADVVATGSTGEAEATGTATPGSYGR